MSLNKAMLIGNVGQDPEIRHMPNGSAVANLSVATSETWKDKNTGDKQEKTEWHRVVVFGNLANIVESYVRKGSKLYIEGKIQTRSWEQDGAKKYSTEIVANQLQMLNRVQASGSVDNSPQKQENDDQFEDIPF